MTRRRLCILALLVLTLAVSGCAGDSERERARQEASVPYHRETLQFSLPAGATILHTKASAQGSAVAMLLQVGDKVRLEVTGQSATEFEGFREYNPPNLGGSHFIQLTEDAQYIVLNPDEGDWLGWGADGAADRYLAFDATGEHVAFAMNRQGQWHMMVDGQLGPSCEYVWPPSISEAGGTVAYAVLTGDEYAVVVGDVMGKRYDGLDAALAVSPNGNHYAYAVPKGDKWCMVMDGVEGQTYEQASDITFSPDGEHYAYIISRGQNTFFVIDGIEQALYDGVAPHVEFGPQGQRHVYFALDGDRNLVVLDGEEFDAVDGLVAVSFSDDGKHCAYVIRRGTQLVVFIDGQEKWTMLGERCFRPVFSPDGTRLACRIDVGGRYRVVVDGVAGRVLDSSSEPVFSPDGSHFAHTASEGGEAFLYIDGNPVVTGLEDVANNVAYNAADHHAFWGWEDGTYVLVVDGERGETYDEVYLPNAHEAILFRDDGSLAYVVRRGDDIYLIEHRP